MRVGQGYDVHPFDPSRRLVLGGVLFEGEAGLAGHSDADVLAHAITDALLGAAALGDIGSHFPSTDDRWAGADSLDLLRSAAEMVRKAGLKIGNVDATLVCQRPRVSARAAQMRVNLARAMGVEPSRVSVKATTTDGLGAIGRGEGIAAMAVALLE
jgi:2-C-methyl-D-erythritol 2,4-cyclodiphosphate synthase